MTNEEALALVPTWRQSGKQEFFCITQPNRRVTIGSVEKVDAGYELWSYGMLNKRIVEDRELAKLAVEQSCADSNIIFAAILVAGSRGRFPGLVSTLRSAILPTADLVEGEWELSLGHLKQEMPLGNATGLGELAALKLRAMKDPKVVKNLLELNGMKGANDDGTEVTTKPKRVRKPRVASGS